MNTHISNKKLTPHFFNYVKSKYNTFCNEIERLEKFMPVMEYSNSDEGVEQYERDLIYNTICPHCNNQTEYLHDSTILYGIDKGPIYYCPCKPGGVYVGCHTHDQRLPLGFPADRHLRQYRIKVHAEFDILWKNYHSIIKNRDKGNYTLNQCRTVAYRVLASHMNVTHAQYAHIGWFNVSQCRRAIHLCKHGNIMHGMIALDTLKAMYIVVKDFKLKGIKLNMSDPTDKMDIWYGLSKSMLKQNYIKPGSSKTTRKSRKGRK